MKEPTMAVAPLFKPFRALGYITDNVPFAVNRRGKETFVTVSVGKAWQVYNCNKLVLKLIGPQLAGDIRALACKDELTFAAVGNDIVECKRVHRSGVYRGGHAGPVRQLLPLGDLLISLGGGSDADRRLVVWRLGQYDSPERVVELPEGFRPCSMCHPATYLNKVLVGSEGGQMALINIRTGDTIHVFKGWGCAVRTLVSSPALDVVGVGLADGRAVMHNVRYDEEVITFANAAGAGLATEMLKSSGAGTTHGGGGACTALSFRTGTGVPLLAAGGGGGVVTVWNLEERRLHAVVRDAHDAPLVSLHFFAGEPLLMSAAADNSLKHWVFDGVEAAPRLLRFRAGHAAPPCLVRHYGQGGLRLLSAGCDRTFRVFSVHQDQQSRELSQGKLVAKARKMRVAAEELRLERVVDMAACEVRERDWSNVVTAHEGDPAAYTWRLAHFTRGEHVLRPPEEELQGCPAAPVTSVSLSPCGNFGLVGSAAGRLDRYNLQSGLHRGAFYRSAKQHGGQQQQGEQRGVVGAAAAVTAHSGAVVGCAVDGSNRLAVSAGLDGVLRVWDFRSQTLRAEVSLPSPASRLCLHPISNLAAVGLVDYSVRLYDIEEPRLVRRFRGHSDRITDVQLSSDGRWLLSAAMDGCLRVWDVPGAQCMQVMKLGSPITSLSLSPALDLLATTHVNRRGIYLWSNQALFGPPAAIPPSDQPVSVVRATLPSISQGRRREGEEEEGEVECEGDDEDEDGMSSEEEEAEEETRRRSSATASAPSPATAPPAPYSQRDPVSGAPLPLAPRLVTLSLLPRSHWDSLTHIEVIKARNKPLQPPKKPEAAPFFLPTLPGISSNPVFDTTAPTANATNQDAAARADGGAADTANGGGPLPGWEEAGARGASEDDEVEDPQGSGDGEGDEEAAGAGPGSTAALASRVKRIKLAGGGRSTAEDGGAPVSPLLRLLRKGAAAAAKAAAGREGGGAVLEAYGPVMALLRSMSPTAIDRELRAMQVLSGSREESRQEADLAALMDMLLASLAAQRDYEFCQALLTVLLAQHGDVISSRAVLAARAAELRTCVAASWRRLDEQLQAVRCMVSFFGNLQG